MKFVLDKKFRECYFDYSEWKIQEEKEGKKRHGT